jgi:photosystem II stability/assembly factor-like uncharacterized protein
MQRNAATRWAADGLALAAVGLLAVTMAACTTTGSAGRNAGAGSTAPGTAGSGAASPSSSAASGTSPARAVSGPAGGPVPHGFQPVSMTFVSASDGWVLGTAPCAQQPCTSVVRTTDGGRSWIGIPAPRYPLAETDLQRGLRDIRFADNLDGFAFGSQLWVTHDGGATWRHVPLPGSIGDLETSDGFVYAAVMTGANAVTVYESPSSGGRWTPVPGLPANVPGNGWLGMITLHGPAAWIILGGRLYASPTGRNWAREPVSCGSGYGMVSVAAYSTQQLTLLCVGDPAMGSAGKVLLESSDGGARFTRSGVPPLGGDNFDQLAQPTAGHIFIATFSGATWLDVSGNAGRTWSQALRLLDGGLGWSDFGFTTASQGAAIEGNPAQGSRMYMTWDAGLAWHTVTF